MNRLLVMRKCWRTARRVPGRAIRDWLSVFLNKGELFGFTLAILTSYIGLQTATIPQVVAEAEAWMDAVQAFVYVALGWAIICLVRAPFVLAVEDRRLGYWEGARFIYHDLLLAKTLHCRPTGEIEMYKFELPHVEPGSFVYCSLDVEGPKSLTEIGIGGRILMGVLPHHSERRTGFSLPKRSRSAILQIKLPTNAVSATVRVYCHSFIIGEPEDQDGTTGNYRFPLRPPPKGDDRP